MNVKGIDLVLAAHDHKVTAEKLINGDKEIWLLEAGSRASTLSKANIDLTIKDGKVVSTNVTGESISMTGVTPDAEYTKFFREEFLKVKEFTNRPVGMLNNDIASRDAYFGSSAYMDMIHTLQLKASGADISFAAPLSYDTKIDKGELNYQNLLDIYPFENQLYVIEMTGQEIKDYLEYSYSMWVNDNPSQNGHLFNVKVDDKTNRISFDHPQYNFDSAAGIKYEVDITKEKGEKISILSLADGTPFKMDAKYNVAMTSYRASGGGDLLQKGAGVPKEEMESRLVARLADIRNLLYNQIQTEDGSTPIPYPLFWVRYDDPEVRDLLANTEVYNFKNDAQRRTYDDIFLLKNYENSYNNRDKERNSTYSQEYVNSFTDSEPIPGIEYEYNINMSYMAM